MYANYFKVSMDYLIKLSSNKNGLPDTLLDETISLYENTESPAEITKLSIAKTPICIILTIYALGVNSILS